MVPSAPGIGSMVSADLGEQVFYQSPHLALAAGGVLGYLTKDVEQVNGSIQALLVVVVNLAIVLLWAVR